MQRIFETIRNYHMIGPGMRILAGISGGADSVCLLLVLSEYRKIVPFHLTAVHVEHGIRGKESLEDAAFTGRLCGRLGVDFVLEQTDVPELAKQRQTSLEETARSERYRIFEKVRRERGAERIAVAHNRNDQAETVLWNLVRGSGLKGLGGMRPVRDRIIRPLLFTEREQIEQIVLSAGLTWRTDRTNLEQEYTRNRIRLSVLPQMERELNSRAVLHIAQASEKLQDVWEYLDRVSSAASKRCIVKEKAGVSIQLEPFRKEDALIRRELIRRALEMCSGSLKNIGSVHLETLSSLALMDCGKRADLPGGVMAVREKDTLRLVRKSCLRKEFQECKETVCKKLKIPGRTSFGKWKVCTELMPNSEEVQREAAQEKKYTKLLSYDIMNRNVLLRTRETGDYLTINAKGGTKKLKDYFIDRKVPRMERDEVLLVADGPHILWAVGYRISEAAKVRPDTRKVLKIQLKETGEDDEGKGQDFFAGAGSKCAHCRDSEADQ
ncbi:MAG TPA: tRNA lysidine(34) synthetase TilS [Candidatus Choladousia intestinipullorum]|nr:tRNA lysidine(34) synthetase TilS [Candidatus Choladousia intestinipullorum]